MGRTILDGGGDRSPGRRPPGLQGQATRWPPRPGGAGGGRGGGGGDPPGVSGFKTFLKFVVAILAIIIIAGVGLVAYASLNKLPSLLHGGVERFDTPVSDDSTRVTFTVKPGQSAAAIGDELLARG